MFLELILNEDPPFMAKGAGRGFGVGWLGKFPWIPLPKGTFVAFIVYG
jgi:hypothetical protein